MTKAEQVAVHIMKGTDGSAITFEHIRDITVNGEVLGEMNWSDVEQRTNEALAVPSGKVSFLFSDYSVLTLTATTSDKVTIEIEVPPLDARARV